MQAHCYDGPVVALCHLFVGPLAVNGVSSQQSCRCILIRNQKSKHRLSNSRLSLLRREGTQADGCRKIGRPRASRDPVYHLHLSFLVQAARLKVREPTGPRILYKELIQVPTTVSPPSLFSSQPKYMLASSTYYCSITSHTRTFVSGTSISFYLRRLAVALPDNA